MDLSGLEKVSPSLAAGIFVGVWSWKRHEGHLILMITAKLTVFFHRGFDDQTMAIKKKVANSRLTLNYRLSLETLENTF